MRKSSGGPSLDRSLSSMSEASTSSSSPPNRRQNRTRAIDSARMNGKTTSSCPSRGVLERRSSLRLNARATSTESLPASLSQSLSSPPEEMINLFPLNHPDRAQCLLTVPNHNLHCYPVSTHEHTRTLHLRLLPTHRSHRRRWHSNSSNRVLVKLFAYLCVIAVLVATLQVSSTLSQYHVHFDYEPAVLPNVDTSRAIFVISMGRQASESKIVERFVMSIRRRGNWNGYVAMLTDAPYDRYQDLQRSDGHLIVMHPKPEHFNWETNLDMPYKRFKTHVLDYVDADSRLDSVQLVYYLDVDIVVGNELSLFFEYIESQYQISSRSKLERAKQEGGGLVSASMPSDPNKESNIYFFKGNFAKTPVQGGQIIMERDSARNCLLWWRTLIDTHTNQTKDQPFLKYMQEHNHNNTFNCHMTVMEQEPHLNFPSAKSVEEMNAKWPSQRQYASLLHIKNTGKVRLIPEAAETKYISDVLKLRYFWDPHRDVGRKMHFDPDEPPWSPLHKNSTWTPTYDFIGHSGSSSGGEMAMVETTSGVSRKEVRRRNHPPSLANWVP